MSAEIAFSNRIANLRSSPIREILRVIDQPGMVSFAGGLPALDTFPSLSLDGMPVSTLQYGASEGEPALRSMIAQRMQGMGLDIPADQVMVVSGSQQGIDLVAKLFIDPGSRVALESPSYLAALQVFNYYGMQPISLNPDEPEMALATGTNSPPLTYIIPTFQNPTGNCWTGDQRERLAQLADETGTVVFEDDPYRDLVYDSVDRQPVCARLRKASWIYQGSFSKSLAPGLRVGFMVASADLMPFLLRLKQASDLHTSRISQWLILQQLQVADEASRLLLLAEHYRARRDAFQADLLKHFEGLAAWELPPGGLFFWLRLAGEIDTSLLLDEAIRRNVAFMPGEPFFIDQSTRYPALRLNFSHAADADRQRGLQTLAGLLRERL
ncbi:aminotransferase-like domain-containing protein [Granulosicoccus sp. 3-233]|uniref:aminotransferase-like domain-containing protein n=1 Tax=Granulosicoccus sp. 3-233 TaxID=3417969 RepID=UPI003D3422D9